MRHTPCAFDVETKIVAGDPAAHIAGAGVALWGILHAHNGPELFTGAPNVSNFPRPLLIVGHNLTFDMTHLLRHSADTPAALAWFMSANVALFDTQIAHYLLTGCSARMPALETVAAHYEVPFTKDAWAAEAFEKGIGADILLAEDAPRLRKYLVGDLYATLAVFRQIVAALKNAKLERVAAAQMRAQKFVILCEYFGMPVDQTILAELQQTAADAKYINDAALNVAVDALLTHPIARAQFNAASPKQLAALLYGGTFTYKERCPVGVYKTGTRAGMPRHKIVLHPVSFPALIPASKMSADERALSLIAARRETPHNVATLARTILAAREPSKLISTYYAPITNAIAASADGRLHGRFHMAVTNTGRKSSSDPNLQNIPDAVRAAIRAEKGRVIVAGDFSQLEIVAAAHLSGCPRLRKMLLQGASIHGLIQARVEKQLGHAVERTDIKRIVFGRIYGGGAETLAAQSGVPIAVVEKIIASLDNLSRPLVNFFKRVEAELQKNKAPIRNMDAPGQSYGATYRLPTGRLLSFETSADANAWGQARFSIPQMKNRPIQAFATADFVPFAEALQFEWFAARPHFITEGHVRPIAVVHDESVYDASDDVGVRALCAMFVWLRENVVTRFNAWFSTALDLPIEIKMGAGSSWLDAKNNGAPV